MKKGIEELEMATVEIAMENCFLNPAEFYDKLCKKLPYVEYEKDENIIGYLYHEVYEYQLIRDFREEQYQLLCDYHNS